MHTRHRTNPTRHHPPVAAALLAGLLAAAAGCGRRTVSVELHYTPPPQHPEVFATPDVDYNIAVARVDVDWHIRYRGRRASDQGTLARYRANGSEAGQSDNARLWDDQLRSQLRTWLASAAREQGVRLTIVDREHLSGRLREKDLRDIDLVPGNPGNWRGQELGIDAFVYATLNIDTVYETQRKQSAIMRIIGHTPVLGRYVPDGPKNQVRRTMTLTGEIQLVDGATGRVWATYPVHEQWVEVRKSRLSDQTLIDLAPEEEQIAGALDRVARGFVGLFFPVEQRLTLRIESSRNKHARRGLRLLQAGEPADALHYFELALQESPEDHRALFAAGVACETLGRFEAAQRYYKQAVAFSGKTDPRIDDPEYQYALAVRRVNNRLASGKSFAPSHPPNRQVSDEPPSTTRPPAPARTRPRSQP